MTTVQEGIIRNPRNRLTPLQPQIAGVSNLGDLVVRAADRWPGKAAWRFDDSAEPFSFGDVERLTRHTAAALDAAGVRPGDRVVVLARNTVEFPAAWLALARLGAIMVPLNTSYQPTDASHVCNQSEANAIIVIDEFLELAETVVDRCPTVQSIIRIEPIIEEWRSGELREPGVVLDNAGLEHPSNIQFTSGTTGKPKGCLLSHQYWLSTAWTVSYDFPNIDDADVMLTAQPFHYIDPQWNLISSLLSGAELVILDRFHPSSFWQKVRDYSVTYFYCLGLMPTLLLRMPPSVDDKNHRVRAIQCSAIPTDLHRQLEERWGVSWFEAFGMTETGADIFVGPDEHDESVGSGCLGRPRSHREALVIDGDGNPVAAGEPGELLLRGSGITSGYFGDPDATSRTIIDGWMRTGDLVTHDGDGRLYFRGRMKDMIRRSGENISAIEVEEVLRQHPQVAMAAIVAVPDDLRGEEVLAFLVPSERIRSDLEFFASVLAHCAAELAYFKVPRYWRSAESLPLTASERIAKHLLVQGEPLGEAWDSKGVADGALRHP